MALNFGEHMGRAIDDMLIGRFQDTGELCMVRFKFKRPSSNGELSQGDPPRIIEVFRGEGDAKVSVGLFVMSGFKIQYAWVKTFEVKSSDLLLFSKLTSTSLEKEIAELTAKYRAFFKIMVGRGEEPDDHLEEIIWLASIPGVSDCEKEKVTRWAFELIERERKDDFAKTKLEATALHEEHLKKFPRRLPHEPQDVDHYKNRRDVFKQLLYRNWPKFSQAWDELQKAKTAEEVSGCKKRVLIAYLADYKTLYDCHPKVRQQEAADFAQDDYYIRLMGDVLNAPKSRVDKKDWQLLSGWIEKNYYRMNETQLEAAFATDWNYKPGLHKGNTLAKHARRIGLLFALQRGRPEKPNSLPPG